MLVSLDGSTTPRYLPRLQLAPVFVTVAATVASDDSGPPPPLSSIEIAVGARGGISTAGLPTCPRSELRASSYRRALAACGSALVGRGHLRARVEFPEQKPTNASARLLAFNGRASSGRTAVWVLVYPSWPAPRSSFVLPFFLQRLRTSAYGFRLRAPISQTLGRWWHLRSFRIRIGRRYRAEGAWRSYLRARCPLPPRFHVGFFPLARATFEFAPRPTIRTTILRACRVRR